MPSISIPIIDLLAHPPIDRLSRFAIPGGPFTNFFSGAPPQDPLHLAFTYGIALDIHPPAPPHWGLKLGAPVEYIPYFAQVTSHYTDLSGADHQRQVTHVNHDAYIYLWDEPLPTLVSVFIEPGWALDLSWYQT